MTLTPALGLRRLRAHPSAHGPGPGYRRGNVAEVEIPGCTGGGLDMTWYGPGGRVVGRFGHG